MKVQEINLTEADILCRFSDMEEKFQRREGLNYFPSLDFYLKYYDDREGAIREEANKMIEFAGLGTYRSIVKFEILDGAAGNIVLNHNMVAEITIDEGIAESIDAVMATLAHEICHKVLHKHGIYYKGYIEKENEVMADLATFYLGFGDLTMKGYKINNIHMGYLSPQTYAMAYVLMTVVNQNVEYNIEGLPRHAQFEIENAKRKCELLKSNFGGLSKDNYNLLYSDVFSEIRKLYEYYDLLLAVLPQIHDSISTLSKDLSNAFYKFDIKDLEWHKFSIAFHSYIFARPNVENNILLQELKDHFGAAFSSIYRVLSLQKINSDLRNIERHCPTCGYTIKKTLEPREYHLVCPKCKTHFTIDGDLSRIIDELSRFVQESNNKECDAFLENTRLKDEIERLTEELEMYKSIAEETKSTEVNEKTTKNKSKVETPNDEDESSFIKRLQRKLWNNNNRKKTGQILYDKNGRVIKKDI